MKGLARQLNQAQCGQRAQTDCYLNRQTLGAVGRLHPATVCGGQINWQAGGLSLGAEPGPVGEAGAATLPSKDKHAEGAGGQGQWRPVQP